jgi:hypothetical protein
MEIDVQTVERKTNHARHDLRLHAIIDPLQPSCTGRAHRFGRCWIDILNVLGEKLAVKTDGRERQGNKAGEGTESEQLDEEDRQDDFLETARQGKDAPTDIVDWPRRYVPCGAKSDRDRCCDTDHSRGHRDAEAFDDPLTDVAPAAGEIRREERGKEARTTRQTLPDTRPIHLRRAESQREVDKDTEAQRPAQPGGLDKRRFFPTASGDAGDRHGRITSVSPCDRGAAGCCLVEKS